MYYKLVNDDRHIVFDSFDKAFKKEDETSIKLHSLTPDQIVDLMDMHANGAMNLIVALTTECDLRCSYCFENHLNRRPMSIETCITLLDDLEQYIIKNNVKRIFCTLFGGEPLLNDKILHKFVTSMNVLCKRRSVKVSYLITTNGLLADEHRCRLLNELNIESIQVTFDGAEQTNNRRRQLADKSENAYRLILNNLRHITEVFSRVYIKFNIDSDNSHEYESFLNDLQNYVEKERVIILLESINKTPFNEYKYSYDAKEKELAIRLVDLISTTIKYGFDYFVKAFNTPCMHTSYNSYLIDTYGNAFSCISSFNLEEFKIGKFNRDISSKSKVRRKAFQKIECVKSQCTKCFYLPACWGGCAYRLKSQGKDIFKDLDCRKYFYDILIEEFYNRITRVYGVDKIV